MIDSFLFLIDFLFSTAAPRHKVIDNNLNIKEVALEDGGLYVCRATQSNPMIADFKEMNITLKIQRKSLGPLSSASIDFSHFFFH